MSGITTAAKELRRGAAKRRKAGGELASYEVASQWKLMWWKFKKHKVAVASAIVLGVFYLIAVFANF
ncbi:hypothetical protein [Gordoniibacillus kamchatkensis]|uniref:hypothetical protein n=1 Tax=Gordoniibacillus kamchatkensis TaxID=1590651 RepID=UPI000B23EFFB|nr:hypothetical protein [Paenibacillus sp. VKM B-2647]